MALPAYVPENHLDWKPVKGNGKRTMLERRDNNNI